VPELAVYETDVRQMKNRIEKGFCQPLSNFVVEVDCGQPIVRRADKAVCSGVKMKARWRKESEKQTGVVKVGTPVRECQNLAMSCTDFVHAWSPSWAENA